mgnify:CR=1 FL=1
MNCRGQRLAGRHIQWFAVCAGQVKRILNAVTQGGNQRVMNIYAADMHGGGQLGEQA